MQKKNNENMNLADDRISFIDFFTDEKANVRFTRCSGDPVAYGFCSFFWLDKIPALIGDRLGGGKQFKWLGVNERRLRIDVVYGDKNMLGETTGIGDNGINGEFGVWTRL